MAQNNYDEPICSLTKCQYLNGIQPQLMYTEIHLYAATPTIHYSEDTKTKKQDNTEKSLKIAKMFKLASSTAE